MRYRSIVADSARWDEFDLRPSDIVISTPPKSGTTWTQRLCALLVFDGPDLPAPLDTISPWLDMQDRSMDDVRGVLGAQAHRRFIKTHTPLDGLPFHDDVTYVVVGRDPRDVAVSWEHHMANVRVDRFIELRAAAVGLDDLEELGFSDSAMADVPEDPAERFRLFRDTQAEGTMMTLAGILHHLDTGWQRRRHANVVMMHYADLRVDPVGELQRLAVALGVEIAPDHAAELAAEASIERMRARADEMAPNTSTSLLTSNAEFFRAGSSGEWRTFVSDDDAATYDARVAALVDPDLARWAHHGRLASGIDPAIV